MYFAIPSKAQGKHYGAQGSKNECFIKFAAIHLY